MYLEGSLFLDTVLVYCFCNCTYQKFNMRSVSDGTFTPDTTKDSLKLSLRFLSPKVWSCSTITTWNNKIWDDQYAFDKRWGTDWQVSWRGQGDAAV